MSIPADTPVGTAVQIAAEFGGGQAVIEQIQHVTEDGQIVDEPAFTRQYLLDNGFAYNEMHLTVAP